MSLNGLDNATVIEAHTAAAVEPGGWFLLKYASRDEVDLESRGTGGIVELRNAIAKYEEQSPLYGFLKYRRRNVILKYEPEGCSRLVKARAAVHFNAVCDRLAPYDTAFEIAAAKDLKDTKLSAACSLHTASGSTSSSTSSLRRRRLMEITEEEEEEQRERKRQSLVKEGDERPSSSLNDDAHPFSREPLVTLDPQQLSSLQDTSFDSTSGLLNFEGVPRPVSPAKSDLGVGGRLSSQSTRPELYPYASYTYGKPKVRLAPRPSLETSKRPQTAGNFRPVAALPQGFKLSSKGPKKGKSQDKTQAEGLEHSEHGRPDITFTSPMSIPEDHESALDFLPPRPATSSGASMKSVSSMTPSFKEKMTPEKARLMKAMKLRQQKKKMSMILDESPVAAETSTTETKDEKVDHGPVEEQEPQEEEGISIMQVDCTRSLPITDSGIAVDLPTPLTMNTEAHTYDTATDSHPASPTAASSEIGDSTKASSLSDSTDETIPATKNLEADADEDETSHFSEEPGTTVNDEADRSDEPAVADVVQEAQEAPANENKVAQDESSITLQIETPEPCRDLKTETHDDANVLKQDDTIAEETRGVPEYTKELPATKEPGGIGESIVPRNEPEPKKKSLAIRTREVELPPREEAAPPKAPYGIPLSRFSNNEAKSPSTPTLKSKFSKQDLKTVSEPVHTIISPPPVPAITEIKRAEEEKHASSAISHHLALETRQTTSLLETKASKRKVAIERINTGLAKDFSQSEATKRILEDDDLMDELQAAKVEEAVMVSKSPITSVFPTFSHKKTSSLSRAVSSPMRAPLLAPGDVSLSSARSASAGGAAFLPNITRQPSNAGLQAKKGGLGSSISQRIKALEKQSGTVGAEAARPRSATPSSNFFTVRKQSLRDLSKSPVAERTSSLTTRVTPPEQSRERSESPTSTVKRERSGSVASRLSMFEVPGVNLPRGRPESIQVTARIIRDPNQSFFRKPEIHKEPADFTTAELKQSPLVVDHQKGEPAPPTTSSLEPVIPVVELPEETIQERRLSRDLKSTSEDGNSERKRGPSLSIVKDFIKDRRASISGKSLSTDNLVTMSPPAASVKSSSRPPSSHHNSGTSIARRVSISSRRSSLNHERDGSTPVMSPSAFTEPGSGDDDKASEKKAKGRASRFMRRLSISFGTSRKNATPNISPTVAEENPDDVAPAASMAKSRIESSQSSVATYIGDVNVQFPDNLLWKRRSMSLDSLGFLILSVVHGTTAHGKDKAGVKRYHLSDFQKPYTPDVEVQELPNSVVLDFVDGSGLQIACEDRQGQRNVLQILDAAHQTHSSFGQ